MKVVLGGLIGFGLGLLLPALFRVSVSATTAMLVAGIIIGMLCNIPLLFITLNYVNNRVGKRTNEMAVQSLPDQRPIILQLPPVQPQEAQRPPLYTQTLTPNASLSYPGVERKDTNWSRG